MQANRGPELTDPYDLDRFVQAQTAQYTQVLAELRACEKRSHWMWYICPQIEGLGHSGMSRRYAIRSTAEASAYLAHPLLGARLRECFDIVSGITHRSAHDIFGSPDDMKLRSCATLFDAVACNDMFGQVLDKYFHGERDPETLRRLK